MTQSYNETTEIRLRHCKSESFHVSLKRSKIPNSISMQDQDNMEGERRNVTVMFADISGFTSISERMDPEEMILIINECFRSMGELVEANGGTIDKYIGDCIMAIFGAPAAIEEAPRNALNAAIEICNWMDDYNETKSHGNTLGVHIGINSGMVIAGPVGSGDKKEYTVMGDTVNVASRLKDVSHSGQIFVGHETYRYTSQYFSFLELEPLKLKGKEMQVRAWSLVSRKEKVHRASLFLGRNLGSVMVGRQWEFDQLMLGLMKLVNGEGGIINVIGEAGIGKSRLIAELRNKDDIHRVTFMEGRALSFGRNLSFYPIKDVIKSWAKINENDSDKQAYYKLKDHTKKLLADNAEEIFPFIATMMGMQLNEEDSARTKGIEGKSLEGLILKSMDTLIVKSSQQKPIVIVMEDIHWADNSSIDLLESLFRLSEQYPVLFINLMRPGYEETGERILQAIRSRYPDRNKEIILKVLNNDDSDHLIRNLIKMQGFPGKVKNDIIKQTGGNPFFIEEIIRSFIDEGVIQQKGDSLFVNDKINSIKVPTTVMDVLMARIDRLDEDSRSLLKVASVIGRNFYYRILRRINEDREDVDSLLNHLEDVQFIRMLEDKAEIQYIFRHALAQEAAYSSILQTKRKQLHMQTAKAIESIFSEKLPEFYGMLAMHYSKAEDFPKAEEYLLKAGEAAIKTSASSEAVHYFSEALELYSKLHSDQADPHKVVQMEIAIGTAHVNKGQLGEALPYYRKAMAYYGIKLNDSTLSLVYMLLSSTVNLIVGMNFPSLIFNKIPDRKEREIIELHNKLSSVSAFESDKMVGVMSFWALRKMMRYDPGKCNEAAQIMLMSFSLYSYIGISGKLHRKALKLIKGKLDQGNVRTMINYEASRAINSRFEGKWNDQDYDTELVNNCLRLGITWETSTYILMVFFTDIARGKFEESERKIDKLAEIGREFDYNLAVSWHLITAARLNLIRRNLDQAMSFVNQHIAYSKKINDLPPIYWGYSTKAMIQVLSRDLDGAEESLQSARNYPQGSKLRVYSTIYVTARFVIDLLRLEDAVSSKRDKDFGKLNTNARRSGKQALKDAAVLSDNRIENYRHMGTYYWLIGKQKKALKWWNKAVKIGEEYQAMPELARVYLEAGKRMARDKARFKLISGKTPVECLERAASIFKQYHLSRDLEEMQKASLHRV